MKDEENRKRRLSYLAPGVIHRQSRDIYPSLWTTSVSLQVLCYSFFTLQLDSHSDA